MRNRIEKTPKVGTSIRLTPLVKQLMAVERSKGESDGDYIERLVLASVATPEGKDLLRRWIETNPTITAMLTPFGKSADTLTR